MEADKVKKKIEKIKIRYQMELDTLIKITKSIVVSDERLIGAIKQRYQEKLDKVQKFYSSFLNLMLDSDREFLIKCANERGALKNNPVYSKGETNWFVKNKIEKRTITESEYGEESMGLSKKINDITEGYLSQKGYLYLLG